MTLSFASPDLAVLVATITKSVRPERLVRNLTLHF